MSLPKVIQIYQKANKLTERGFIDWWFDNIDPSGDEEIKVINTHGELLSAVALYQEFNILDYSSSSRKPDLVDGRKAYSQLANKYLDISLTKAGNLIGRSHDTMIYYNKCEYKTVKGIVEYIEKNYQLPKKTHEYLPELTQDQKTLIRTKLR